MTSTTRRSLMHRLAPRTARWLPSTATVGTLLLSTVLLSASLPASAVPAPTTAPSSVGGQYEHRHGSGHAGHRHGSGAHSQPTPLPAPPLPATSPPTRSARVPRLATHA